MRCWGLGVLHHPLVRPRCALPSTNGDTRLYYIASAFTRPSACSLILLRVCIGCLAMNIGPLDLPPAMRLQADAVYHACCESLWLAR